MFYDYFDEKAADNAEVVSEIMNIAKGLVSEEIKEKLDTQKKRIAELEKDLEYYRAYREEKIKLDQEISRLNHEADISYNKGYNDCKKEKLKKLANLRTAWAVLKKSEYVVDKCDKCDDDRFIHFKSPSGKDFKEECSCKKFKYMYYPQKVEMCAFVLGYNNSDNPPLRYYSYKSGVTAEENLKANEVRFEREGEKIWVYEDFTDFQQKIAGNNPKDFYTVCFETEEECQKYCNWLSENNNN